MNSQTAPSFIPLVQALAEGKTIQFLKPIRGWTDIKDVEFCQAPDRYRVKPEPSEPREIWVNEYAGGLAAAWHPSKKQALDSSSSSMVKVICFREVLPETETP